MIFICMYDAKLLGKNETNFELYLCSQFCGYLLSQLDWSEPQTDLIKNTNAFRTDDTFTISNSTQTLKESAASAMISDKGLLSVNVD